MRSQKCQQFFTVIRIYPDAVLNFHKAVSLKNYPQSVSCRAPALPNIENDDTPFSIPTNRALREIKSFEDSRALFAFFRKLKCSVSIFLDNTLLIESRERLADSAIQLWRIINIFPHIPEKLHCIGRYNCKAYRCCRIEGSNDDILNPFALRAHLYLGFYQCRGLAAAHVPYYARPLWIRNRMKSKYAHKKIRTKKRNWKF